LKALEEFDKYKNICLLGSRLGTAKCWLKLK
jgi:hypothetical protein